MMINDIIRRKNVRNDVNAKMTSIRAASILQNSY